MGLLITVCWQSIRGRSVKPDLVIVLKTMVSTLGYGSWYSAWRRFQRTGTPTDPQSNAVLLCYSPSKSCGEVRWGFWSRWRCCCPLGTKYPSVSPTKRAQRGSLTQGMSGRTWRDPETPPPPVVQHNPQAPFGAHPLTKRLSPRGLPIPACNASPPGGGPQAGLQLPACNAPRRAPPRSQPAAALHAGSCSPAGRWSRTVPPSYRPRSHPRPPAPLRSALLPAPPGVCPSRRRKPRRERGSRGGRERRDGGLQSQGGGARPPHEPARWEPPPSETLPRSRGGCLWCVRGAGLRGRAGREAGGCLSPQVSVGPGVPAGGWIGVWDPARGRVYGCMCR